MTQADYIYKRKDGGTTYCYGEVREDSNFEVTCDNEINDGVYCDNDSEKNNTWRRVAKHLEEVYDTQIEELVAC